MPNIKSAIKRVRIEEKKTLNNNVKKSEYKTAVRKFEKAVAEKSKDAKDLMKNAQKAIGLFVNFVNFGNSQKRGLMIL